MSGILSFTAFLSLWYLFAIANALSFSKTRDARSLPLRVDLGYEIYQGVYNDTNKLNEYKGIRYAASTGGKNRWQPPQPPVENRGSIIQANALPQRCPQGPQAPSPASYNFTGTEDCLFLSVYAPADAKNLPVLVVIHGGGYGTGQGSMDTTTLQGTNSNAFVSVVIQYRLGAFGFLAGDEVHTFGKTNAGLLDQHYSLEWVQKYIHLFGGDKTRVTIAGESAGGGSVMLQAMAYGGTEGTKYFENGIAASPYLPMQYEYNGWQPSQAYYSFAMHAGCFPGRAYGNTSQTIFQCLVEKDSITLQNASFIVSGSGTFGTWAFLPVTDGDFVRDRPSRQLTSGNVNGKRVMSGNNANEGVGFTIQNITTEKAFEDWLKLQFPMFNESDLKAILEHYPSTSADVDPSYPRFATTGTSPPYALNVSSFGTGQQQRANNLYSETTFVCPSYWLAQAFPAAYKYQYSVPASQHGADLYAEGLRAITPNVSPQFSKAFQTMWGNFITHNNPSISSELANGDGSKKYNPASNWPHFSRSNPKMLNLNETGGVEWETLVVAGTPNVTEYEEPGLRNDITLQNAWTWEGGRGDRCDFWRKMGAKVPE